MLKSIVAGAILALGISGGTAIASSTSPSLDPFTGVWLVVPRRSPESVAPGRIPQVFHISRHGDTLRGLFQWNGDEFGMRDCALKDALLICTLDDRQIFSPFLQPFKLAVSHSRDGRFIEVWMGEVPAGRAPFLARRVTREQLAAAVRAAPKIDKWDKEPLPPLQDIPANGLALTPPMGWNSWNEFKEAIDDRTVRELADAMVSSGLRDVGYVYINIDDGWQGRRDANGILHPNSKFPDMKALADYVHARGLRFGLYTGPGPISCAGYLGSHGHEEQDARTFAQWGVDLLKYDAVCGVTGIYKTLPEVQALHQKMSEALRASGRPIVYSIHDARNVFGKDVKESWGRKVGAHMWRTGGDSVEGNLWAAIDQRFDYNGDPENAGPGGWNDADMMLVGLPGLTEDEYRTHFTLWAISASPIILGNDLRTMSLAVKAILMNREVIAVDQDVSGVQGRRIVQQGSTEVWTKPLSDGSTAVALFNRGDVIATVEARWSVIGLAGPQHVRDLWTHKDLGKRESGHKADVPPHGSVLIRVSNSK